jgi:Domain of unknown function (DUF4062)
MDKRYQIFVSSTFTDLKLERQAVLTAILELNQMPAGMELFPAGDESAWQLIKDVIDGSDYYVLIIGGRYGSLDETGLGYTEKEYDHATAAKKPVIPLLHQNPDNLPRGRTDTDEAAWAKLKAFRAKIEKRHTCVYWETTEELKAKVIVGLTSAMKRYPAVGWVKADRIPSDATLADMLALKSQVAELEAQLASDVSRPPRGTEDLVQGDETFRVEYTFTSADPKDLYFDLDGSGKHDSAVIEPSWNQTFAAVAPTMINEATEDDLEASFRSFFAALARKDLADDTSLKERKLVDFRFPKEQIETCILQFRALGLIEESLRQRSLKDTSAYWKLTKHGDHLMTQLRAIRRTAPDETAGQVSGEAEPKGDSD